MKTEDKSMKNYIHYDWQENDGYELIEKANLNIKPLKIIEYRKNKKSNSINIPCACHTSLKHAICGI